MSHRETPAPTLVERFLAAIRLSGDDCIATGSYRFQGDEMPYDVISQRVTVKPIELTMPLGNNLVAAAADPGLLGGPVIIIRRAVFEAIGASRPKAIRA